MAPTIFTRAKDIPVALFLSLPVLFFFFVFLVWLNAKKRGNQAAEFVSVQSGSLNAQRAIDCNQLVRHFANIYAYSFIVHINQSMLGQLQNGSLDNLFFFFICLQSISCTLSPFSFLSFLCVPLHCGTRIDLYLNKISYINNN